MDEQTIATTEEVLETTETPVETELDTINSNEISIIEETEPVLGEELHEEVTEVSDEPENITE